MRRALVLALSCVVLAPGCAGGETKPAAKADANAQRSAAGQDGNKDGNKDGKDAKANPHAANPHGAAPGADPHGGNPHAQGGPPPGGPHAGMGGAPPMMAAKEPGPPRDITPSGEVAEATITGLTFSVPKEWESSPPTSSMRLAQWVMPGPGGDGELVVYRFKGGGGSVQANIDRWKGQFQPPEGKSIDDVSTIETIEGEGGLKTTLVDVTGTYVAAVQPGAEQKHNEAAYRMYAAVIEGNGDAYYFKAVGPEKTLALWNEPFSAMIKTFKAAS